MIEIILTIALTVIILGLASYWFFFDKGFNPFFFISLVLAVLSFSSVGNWSNFIIYSFLFVVFVHIYLYDRWFIYFKATNRGRR